MAIRKKFYIFVEGGTSPKKIHDSFEDAESECMRLATMPNTLNKKLFIFEVAKVFKNIPSLIDVTGEVCDD